MTLDLDTIWQTLETEAVGRDRDTVRRRLTKDRDDGMHLGFDAGTRERLFLLELSRDIVAGQRFPRWRQVTISVHEIPGKPTKALVRLGLANHRFTDVFQAFSADLYAHLAPLTNDRAIAEEFVSRLGLWHHFFQEHGPDGLSPEAQRGLLGELWFIRDHLLRHLPPAATVATWHGPDGDPHDFHLRGGHVEVKFSSADDEGTIRINNEHQLDAGQAACLFLFVLEGGPAQDGISLPAIVDEVRASFHPDRSAALLLEQRLLQVGYLDVHANLYQAVYRVRDENWFEVREGFPRLIRPPSGITRVRYRLQVDACRRFRTAPDAAKARLGVL